METHLRRDMRKPTKWLCAQRRLRSAWVSAQSDQSSLSAWRKLGSLAIHWAHSEGTLIRVGSAQADLSLRWAHTHFVGFVMLRLISCISDRDFRVTGQCKDSHLKRAITVRQRPWRRNCVLKKSMIAAGTWSIRKDSVFMSILRPYYVFARFSPRLMRFHYVLTTACSRAHHV